MRLRVLTAAIGIAAATALWFAIRERDRAEHPVGVSIQPADSVPEVADSGAETEPIVVTADASGERSPMVIPAPQEDVAESMQAERAGLDGSIVPLDSLPGRLVRPELQLAEIATDEDELFAEPCAPKSWPGATRVMSGGEFGWRDLDPGTATFRLMLHGEPEPLVVLPEIVIRADDICRDPRVQGIRLEGLVLMHRIAVVGAAGEPLPSALAVRAMPAGGDCLAGFRADDSGEIVIASRASTIAVSVFAPGHCLAEVSEIGAYARVALRRGYDVRIGLAVGSLDVDRWDTWFTKSMSIILEPLHPKLAFLSEENRSSAVDMNQDSYVLEALRGTLATDLSATGEASFCLPASGRYRVKLGIHLRRTKDLESIEPPTGGAEAVDRPDGVIVRLLAGEIGILDVGETQSFEVRPDAEMLQQITNFLAREH